MLKKILSFSTIGLLILTFSFGVESHEKKWPEKRLRQAWPEAQSFTSRQLSLTPAQISHLNSLGIKIGTEDRSPIFYFAQEKMATPDKENKAKNIGIILFVDEYGANGKMEVSVAMGPDGKVHKVDLWEHAENPLIGKDDFLKQFNGKSAKDSFADPKDYHSVPDAIKASGAVAKAVEKALQITSIIFEKK